MDDFTKCPIGIKHEEQIESTREIFEMAINRLEEKIDDIKTDVNEGFANVDERFDSLESRFTNLKNSLPETIDNRIKHNDEKKAAGVTKWLFITLGGSVFITIVTLLVRNYLGI